jgi:hypothetical protein
MNLWRDLRFGFRLWKKNYGFAAIAALTLALGVGATTAIFSVIYATLFEPTFITSFQPATFVIGFSKTRHFSRCRPQPAQVSISRCQARRPK